MSFKAVLLNKDQQGFSARVTELEDEDLPAGSEVLISVEQIWTLTQFVRSMAD